MSTKFTLRWTVLLSLVITLIGFFVWIGVLFVIWFVLKTVGITTDYWAMTEALSTAVAMTAVFGAGFLAYRELSEIASSRYLEVSDGLFQELNSQENITARRWIFQNLPDFPGDGLVELDEDARQYVKTVLNSLDRVAFLTQADWIPEDVIMPWMNPMIVKSWVKLKPYVEYERERRKEPDYYQYVGNLAERCVAWRVKNLPDAEIIWVGDAI
jgi:hypothetical protein